MTVSIVKLLFIGNGGLLLLYGRYLLAIRKSRFGIRTSEVGTLKSRAAVQLLLDMYLLASLFLLYAQNSIAQIELLFVLVFLPVALFLVFLCIRNYQNERKFSKNLRKLLVSQIHSRKMLNKYRNIQINQSPTASRPAYPN